MAPRAKRTSEQRAQEQRRRQARIERERAEMKLKPWEFAPSEVDDGPNPCKAPEVGFASWEKAQQQRREIRLKDPHYFD